MRRTFKSLGHKNFKTKQNSLDFLLLKPLRQEPESKPSVLISAVFLDSDHLPLVPILLGVPGVDEWSYPHLNSSIGARPARQIIISL